MSESIEAQSTGERGQLISPGGRWLKGLDSSITRTNRKHGRKDESLRHDGWSLLWLVKRMKDERWKLDATTSSFRGCLRRPRYDYYYYYY